MAAEELKATVLVDNIGKDEIAGEWGLSVWIEYRGKNILLDTGASTLFWENAKKLGIDLTKTDYAVLSHAHYDHADGMQYFLQNTSDVKFYLREGCAENCYAGKWIFHKYIGIPKNTLEPYKDRIVYAKGDDTICDGATLIPHKTPGLEQIGKKNHMYIKTKYGWKPDDFAHEQSLVFETQQGLVIFNSCSHAGADNIIKEVQATYPQKKIKALIGGFHLFGHPQEEVKELAKRIKETGIEEIYTGHCTGKHAFAVLQNELGECVHQLSVGLEMTF